MNSFTWKGCCTILLSATLFLMLAAARTEAAVGQLGSATFGTLSNTHSFTVPAGENRILLVVASDDNAADISSVSFGASSMSQRAEHFDADAVDSIWTLSLGTSLTSTTATITVVSTGTTPNNLAFIGASAFHGVDQTTPISGVQSVNISGIPSASTLNIASAEGNLVFDIFDSFRFSTSVNTITPGGSQTVLHNAGTTVLPSGGFGFYRTSTRQGAATVPMSWTTSNSEALIHIGVSINAFKTASLFDYDADGRTDISVFRPSNGAWFLNQSAAGPFGIQFGFGTDKIAPADYDGDGKTDIAVYRPSEGRWYIVNSSNGTVIYHVFGLPEDLPAPADYDGDGNADICVFRPSTGTWYRQNSSNGSFFGIQFGLDGDRPTVGDFDADDKADIGIWRPSNGDWYHIRSSDGSIFGERFGISTDKMVPADYDGDGRIDIAVWRPSSGTWYIKQSSDSAYVSYLFGLPTDIPAPGDFDGDGKADRAVFRPSDGTWYITNSTNGSFTIFPWGQNGDRPTPAAFLN